MKQEIATRQRTPRLLGVAREKLAAPRQHALPDLAGRQHADNLARGLQEHAPRSGKSASIGRYASKRQRAHLVGRIVARPCAMWLLPTHFVFVVVGNVEVLILRQAP